MSENTEEAKNKNRRKFLGKLFLVGAGTVTAAGALMSGHHFESKKKESGKKLKLLTADNKVVEIDSIHIHHTEKDPLKLLQLHGREGIPGKRWTMVIDLSKCRNDRRCISACQTAHDLKPEQFHINTLQMQDSPNGAPYHKPKPCQHCDNPPCVSVCPVDATYKRNDGIVLIDNERCIGCRFCMAACPYSARLFHWFEPKVSEEHKNQPYNVELNVPQKKGTISKCLFSADRLRENKLPYCVSACPNGVYWFGDENEDAVTNGTTKETIRLSDLIRDNHGYRLMEELGTKPRVYYLPAKGRLFPFPEDQKPDLHS